MANIHSIRDLSSDSISTSGSNRSVLYSPLNVSKPDPESSSPPPIISFGYRGADGTLQRANCLEAIFPGFSVKTWVFALTIIQIIMFGVTMIVSLRLEDATSGFNCVLYEFGGKFTPSITVFHHVHRLVLPIVLHGSFGHLFFNMLSQWFYGFQLEKTYGSRKFLFLYIIAGIGGNLLSAIRITDSISVGASSSLFGIFALQVAYVLENYDKLGPGKNVSLIIMAFLVLGNLGSASSTDGVDNSAHLGGFLVGALVAVLLVKRETDPKFHIKQKISGLLIVIYLIVTSVMVATLTGLEGLAYGISSECGAVLNNIRL